MQRKVCVILVCIGILFLGACSGKTDDTGNKTSFKKGQEVELKSGLYRCGTDMPAGEYVVFLDKQSTDAGLSQYIISQDPERDNVIDVELIATNMIITVNEGEFLFLLKATAVDMDHAKLDQQKDADGNFEQGMYKVGTHIKADNYKLIPDGGDPQYYVFTDSRRTKMVKGGPCSQEQYISLKNGEYLILQDMKLSLK